MRHTIDAIILSGGESTRFFPLREKNTVAFFGKPLLLWHFEQLTRLGFARAIVVVNPANEKLLKDILPPKHLDVVYVTQGKKGQADALSSVLPHAKNTPCLLLNASDIYEDELIRQMLTEHKKNKDSAFIAAVRTQSYFPGGYVKLGKDGMVVEIVEKPKPEKVPSDIVRTMADFFPDTKHACEYMKRYRGNKESGYEHALGKLIQNGLRCEPVITALPWVSLKYPWHMLSAMEACLNTLTAPMISQKAMVGKNVIIEGPVVLEDGVKVMEGSKIVGPCYIGQDTIIGNNNIIRKSHIGSNCVTGFSTDITRSYIGNSCWFHTNFIGDSIISDNVSIGSGTVLANLRLDESEIFSVVKGEKIPTGRNKLGVMIGRNVRIGVNVSIMPGVKIGEETFVGAGVILGEDLAEKTYCKMSPTVVITQNDKSASVSRDQFKKVL